MVDDQLQLVVVDAVARDDGFGEDAQVGWWKVLEP